MSTTDDLHRIVNYVSPMLNNKWTVSNLKQILVELLFAVDHTANLLDQIQSAPPPAVGGGWVQLEEGKWFDFHTGAMARNTHDYDHTPMLIITGLGSEMRLFGTAADTMRAEIAKRMAQP